MANLTHCACTKFTTCSGTEESPDMLTLRSEISTANNGRDIDLYESASPPGSSANSAPDYSTSTNSFTARPSMLLETSTTALPAHNVGNERFDMSFKNWTVDKEKIVKAPYDYIAAAPGKEFRSLLLESLNEYLRIPSESLEIIQNAIRMLHTSSLLIDDIQDNSTIRRGRPVAHSIFGTAQTINSANYVYFLAFKELQKLSNPEVADIFVSELLCLHRGQAMDLFWRDTLTCPIEAEYLEMVSNKTGGLFRLAYRLMHAEASSAAADLLPLVDILGLLYQIADDYKNLCDGEYAQKKGFGEDLTEGKFSFPVIHCIQADPGDYQLFHILQQKPTCYEVKKYAVSCMERTGSLEYTRSIIKLLVCQAKELLYEAERGSEKGASLCRLLDKLAAV